MTDRGARTGSGRTRQPDGGELTSSSGSLSRRRLLAAIAVAAGSAVAGAGRVGAQADDGPGDLDGRSWELTWSDEFDEGRIDRSVWSFETGGGCGPNGTLGECRWGNNESQYYTDGDNAFVEDGRLVIEAREEPASGWDAEYEYTSSRIVTDGNVSTQYGRIDIRARMPIGQGIWPALWMLPEGNWTWPDDGEIDIMEYLGHEPGTIHATVHGRGFSGADGINASYHLDSGSFHESFHVFSIVWDPDRIQWFVDGERFHEVTKATVEAAGNDWPFDDGPFHVLANIAVGGEWPGYPDETTEFPQRMEIDYVRFYEEGDGDPEESIELNGYEPAPYDGSERYLDVDGSGTLGSNDVVAFFEHVEDPVVQENVAYFDFNGSGSVGFDDVVALFQNV